MLNFGIMHKGALKLILDVAYHQDDYAKVAGGFFRDWEDKTLFRFESKQIEGPFAPYVAGQFYKRELPCLLSFLEEVNLKKVGLLIIDGYVYLDENDRPGLGARLYESLDEKIPVLGVAKSEFQIHRKNVRAVHRGKSEHPLFVSVVGAPLDYMAQHVERMYGRYRIPELIKDVDQASRSKD